jgi:Xaa-Pro aminopeptidase
MLDIAAIQARLAEDALDGWLLYDFHGSNPIAVHLAGLAGRHTTRRWYYFLPRRGQPVKLVHAIEPDVLAGVPGETRCYAGRFQLADGVRRLLMGVSKIAMEYSPGGDIPYLSRVDGGTLDFIRGLGVTVVSSGDLIGRFEAAWDEAALQSHKAASDRLHRIKDQTFEFVGRSLAHGAPVDEFGVQQQMLDWFREVGLVTDAGPIVATQEHTGNPHYSPTPETSRPIRRGELLLLDLWGKLEGAGAVYADITWVGFTGTPPEKVAIAFAAAAAGRDAAVTLVRSRVGAGAPVRGWEVDRAARDSITAAGYGERFIHRTGHSLGAEVHGNGVHMDDFETHDDRLLVPGTGFTIEPGIYLPEFGVRTEINMVVGNRSAEVTGPRQASIVEVGGG